MEEYKYVVYFGIPALLLIWTYFRVTKKKTANNSSPTGELTNDDTSIHENGKEEVNEEEASTPPKQKNRRRKRKGVNFAHVNEQLNEHLKTKSGEPNKKAWFAFYSDHVERVPPEAVEIGASVLSKAAKSDKPED